MTVCRTLNQSENIIRGVFNKIPNFNSSYKTVGIDIAFRNLEIEKSAQKMVYYIKRNIVFLLKAIFWIKKHLFWRVLPLLA